jgi:hypothetical protein
VNPKTTLLGIVAAIGVAGAGVAVTLKAGECRDVLWTLYVDPSVSAITVTGPDGKPQTTKAEPGWTKGEARVCEGEESPLPEGATVVWESPAASAKPLLATGSKATLTAAEVVGGCACGPTTQPKDTPCMVTETGMDGKTVTRPSRPGEHLVSGWSGGCIKKACWETAARKRAGDSVPVECGGLPAVVEAEPKGIEAKQ